MIPKTPPSLAVRGLFLGVRFVRKSPFQHSLTAFIHLAAICDHCADKMGQMGQMGQMNLRIWPIIWPTVRDWFCSVFRQWARWAR